MATLMESYEQQYSTLTADITAKTGRVPNLSGSMGSTYHVLIFGLLDTLVWNVVSVYGLLQNFIFIKLNTGN